MTWHEPNYNKSYKNKFNSQLNKKKEKEKLKFLIFKLNDYKTIILEIFN